MIVEKLISVDSVLETPIPGMILVIIFVISSVFSLGALNQKRISTKLIGICLMAISVLCAIEVIDSLLKKPDFEYVFETQKYPVEYRVENNTMYVFYRDQFEKVSNYTDEYVHKNDTMYVYNTTAIGGVYEWGNSIVRQFTPLTEIHYWDFYKNESQTITQDTVLLEIGPEGGFIIPEALDSLSTDSISQ